MLNDNEKINLQGIYYALEKIQWSLEGLSISVIESNQEARNLSTLLSLISDNLETQVNNLHVLMCGGAK